MSRRARRLGGRKGGVVVSLVGDLGGRGWGWGWGGEGRYRSVIDSEGGPEGIRSSSESSESGGGGLDVSQSFSPADR